MLTILLFLTIDWNLSATEVTTGLLKKQIHFYSKGCRIYINLRGEANLYAWNIWAPITVDSFYSSLIFHEWCDHVYSEQSESAFMHHNSPAKSLMVLQLTVMMPYMDFNRKECLLEHPCNAIISDLTTPSNNSWRHVKLKIWRFTV